MNLELTDEETEALAALLADVERDLIRTRTAEGRSRAKESTWAAPLPSLPNTRRGPTGVAHRGTALDALARIYNVSRATISRLNA